MPTAPIRYHPADHIHPVPHSRYCDLIDNIEQNIVDWLITQIGEERMEELEELDERDGSGDLRDTVWRIRELVAGLFKLPQEKFEYDPYTLGKEDYDPLNFYHPDDHQKCLGRRESANAEAT